MRNKRLIIVFVITIACIVGLLYCDISHQGNTDHVKVDYGTSKKFTKTEIKDVMDCAMKRFKFVKGGVLHKLWYDEEVSNREVGIKNRNEIEIVVSYHEEGTSFMQGKVLNDSYYKEGWTFVRDNAASMWKYKDGGFI